MNRRRARTRSTGTSAPPAEEGEGWLMGLEPATPRITSGGTVVLSAENKALRLSDFGRCTRDEESSHDEALAAVIPAWPRLAPAVRAGITTICRRCRPPVPRRRGPCRPGDGPDLSSVRALARELGLADCVTFHGKQSQPDMEQILQHAWVQAIPSVWEEPFGLVAVEAAMRGTAAVVSSAGGLAEIVVHGETGLHATIRPEPLAAALKVFLTDPAVAERAGAAGRRNALARFPLERNVDRFADLYARLLQAKAKTA